MVYTPPKTIPFDFTKNGYAAPSDELLFNFDNNLGVLNAAIQVMQLYKEQTYTYVKSCPKYVVGYENGRVQILKGKCTYGGIRDLGAFILAEGLEYGQGPLRADIHGWQSADLSAYLKVYSDVNLNARIRPWVREASTDLSAYLRKRPEDYLSANIDAHYPVDINATIRGNVSDSRDLSGYLNSYKPVDLSAIVDTHYPKDLSAYAVTKYRNSDNLSANLFGWAAKDLSAYIKTSHISDISAYISAIPGIDLPAYLKVWPQRILPAYVAGWSTLNLGAIINQVWDKNLPASLLGHDDIYTLPAWIWPVGKETKDISAYIYGVISKDLSAYIGTHPAINLPAYLKVWPQKYLSANTHGWQTANLLASISSAIYPWDLPASIVGSGAYYYLGAYVRPVYSTGTIYNLSASSSGWEINNLIGIIKGDNAFTLSAFVNPVGASSDLSALIKPKMIRLTTVVSLSTMSARDLSAIINSSCVHSVAKDLQAILYIKYKSDLFAYIKGYEQVYTTKTLTAKTGYTDSYLEVDKLNLSINILPSEYFTEDKLSLIFNFLRAQNLLSAYIRGTLRYNDLTARIVAEQPVRYSYDRPIKNREKVINKTYEGVFSSYEIVELSFKSAVKDYYYSSSGDFMWKSNRFDKWMLDVRSILPTDTLLSLRRRLHKVATVYDLRKFISVDEAVRFAIDYVTEYPQCSLGAYINNVGMYTQLPATISPKYTINGSGSLSSSITPTTFKIVLNKSSGIEKI